MDVANDEDDAMAAMMGLNGFGSTKVASLHFIPRMFKLMMTSRQGKQVTGNQDGGVNIKKVRTWRQYMNRYASTLDYWSILLTS